MPINQTFASDFRAHTKNVQRLEALGAELPGPIADAWRAARTLEDAHRAPADDTTAAHNAAVAELMASARTGRSLDTGQAAKAVAAATDARRTADARRSIVEDALNAAYYAAAAVYQGHLVDVIVVVRPHFARLTGRLDDLAQQIPVGFDDAAALDVDEDTRAAWLEASRQIIPQLEGVLAIRQATYNLLGRPDSEFFYVARNMHELEDTRLMEPMASYAEIKPTLPTGVEWWLTLARGHADWWFPTPAEMSERANDWRADALASRGQHEQADKVRKGSRQRREVVELRRQAIVEAVGGGDAA